MEYTKKIKSSNDGYSLIELVVTILISSVIMIAVIGFLTTGLRHYRNVNNEAVLQIESQVADLFITELFQEAQDYRVIDSAKYNTSTTGITYAVEIKRNDKFHILALKNGELWFSEVNGADDTARLSSFNGKGKSVAFLAKYVSAFALRAECSSFSEAWDDTHGLLTINVQFAVDTKTYDNNLLISLRNSK